MRILWIPGRKKHNRKGVYNPTKSSIPQYHAHQQRKNESWSLGGSVNHSKIINADLHDNLDVGMATASGAMSIAAMTSKNPPVMTVALPPEEPGHSSGRSDPMASAGEGSSCGAASGEVMELSVLNDLNGDISKRDIPTSNQFETLELIDECDERDRNYSNAESASSLLSSNNDSRSASDYMHNTATLTIGEARRRQQQRRNSSYNNSKKNSTENLDSIDHLNDDCNDNNDAVDAVKINGNANEPRLDAFRPAHQRKKSNKKKSRSTVKPQADEDEKKEKDDKLVTCLYYSLVCWDCSIS